MTAPRRFRPAFAALVLAALFHAGAASADAEGARVHFEAGKKLRDEGDCGKAIAEFDKSLAAEKSIGAYYNVAYCHEQLGDRQAAYESYKQAQQLASAKHDERVREIGGAITGLLETPHVRLVFPGALPTGLQISVDGVVASSAYYHAETVIFTKPASPHVVLVSASGWEDWHASLESKELRTVDLQRPHTGKVEASPPPDHAADGPWPWQRWAGTGSFVVGAAGFTIGAVVGLEYLSDQSRLKKAYDSLTDAPCDANNNCPPAHVAKVAALNAYNQNLEDGKHHAPFIFGGLIGGGLLMAGGVYLFVTAPKPGAPASSKDSAKSSFSFHIVPAFDATRRGLSALGTF